MAVMKEFKPGDRVEYVGGNRQHHGAVFTIVNVHDEQADVGLGNRFKPWTYNLRHIPAAPDVITIRRSDLPEVTRSASGWLTIGDDTFTDDPTPDERRQWALEHLAIAEYLDSKAAAKETAEKEAADKLAELPGLHE